MSIAWAAGIDPRLKAAANNAAAIASFMRASLQQPFTQLSRNLVRAAHAALGSRSLAPDRDGGMGGNPVGGARSRPTRQPRAMHADSIWPDATPVYCTLVMSRKPTST